MSLEEQRQLEDAYVMPTFARKPIELVSGQGCEVVDDKGNTLLDFIAGIGVCSLGHCHPAVVSALQEQSAKLIHVSNYYYIEGRGELSATLSGMLNNGEPDSPERWQTFYANSGAEANECAIKLARLYSVKRAEAAARAAGACEEALRAAREAAPRSIVALNMGFHGRTLTTLAATMQPLKQDAFKPLPGGFIAAPINDIEVLERLFAEKGDQICAVMLEPIQGESGVHPCTPEFFNAVRNLTHAHDALMICDEVQTGVYRTGKPFAFQNFGVTPDIVSMAKGIASGMVMGACAAREEVASAFEPGDHGSTFGGSCLAVAASRATLAELGKAGFADQVNEVGAYLRAQLSALPQVTEVRGMGLMNACDLRDGIDVPSLVLRALDEGLLLNATGAHTLRFLPPLIVTKAQVDTMIEGLSRLLA